MSTITVINNYGSSIGYNVSTNVGYLPNGPNNFIATAPSETSVFSDSMHLIEAVQIKYLDLNRVLAVYFVDMNNQYVSIANTNLIITVMNSTNMVFNVVSSPIILTPVIRIVQLGSYYLTNNTSSDAVIRFGSNNNTCSINSIGNILPASSGPTLSLPIIIPNLQFESPCAGPMSLQLNVMKNGVSTSVVYAIPSVLYTGIVFVNDVITLQPFSGIPPISGQPIVECCQNINPLFRRRLVRQL